MVTWFSDFGVAALVTHAAGSGIYDLKCSRAPRSSMAHVLSATPDDQPPNVVRYAEDCTAANADYTNSGAATMIVVEIKQCTNSFVDRGFHLVVFTSPLSPLLICFSPQGVSQHQRDAVGVSPSDGNGPCPKKSP